MKIIIILSSLILGISINSSIYLHHKYSSEFRETKEEIPDNYIYYHVGNEIYSNSYDGYLLNTKTGDLKRINHVVVKDDKGNTDKQFNQINVNTGFTQVRDIK